MKPRNEDQGRTATLSTHVLAPRGVKIVTHPPGQMKAHAKKTAHFTISVDSGLGSKGAQVADAILKTCEQDFATLQSYFGGITPKSMPFHVLVTAGSDGASHATCLATALSIGAHSGPMAFMRSLVIAEEDEVFEANFGHGWNCGFSNGEGLSRVLANDIVPGVEPAGFLSAPVWLDDNSDVDGVYREDWVTKTDPTDVNYFSIGCSVLFLNWMRFQLGYSWDKIIAAGGATLAATYKNLTGKNDGWTVFKALIDKTYPPGKPSGLKTDNPFPRTIA